jgi:phenylacetate-CoA ligase
MAGLLDKIYAKLPIPLQHSAVSLYGIYWNQLRFSGGYNVELQAYLDREYFSESQWKQYQTMKLREVLLLAYDHVPYYRETWKPLINREELEHFELEHIRVLPVLEKSVVRDNPQSLLVDRQSPGKYRVNHTSGSSGTPVSTYWTAQEMRKVWALREARSCKFARVSYKMPRATFSGRIVEPNPNSKGPFYRFNWFEKQVYFSAFHLSPANTPQYIQALKRHNIQWLTGYSNSIYQLAQMALDAQLDIPALKAVITTSEKLTSEMRSVIERAFRTEVYEEYGTVENIFYACENEFQQKLISPDAGLVEVVNDSFDPVLTGEYGEVIATGFFHTSQLFIRYRIGDVAMLSDEKPKCGRSMPVMQEVIGRVEDVIYGLDGRRIVRFHGIFVNQPHVREGQIIQDQIDHITVRIVPKGGFSNIDQQDIISRVQQRLTKGMSVSLELVDVIPRTANGKFRAVICNLPQDAKEKFNS